MICPADGTVVEKEHRVKGYEVEEGRYVIVDPEELRRIEVDQGRMVEVKAFVRDDRLDARYLDRVYYLEADQNPDRYAALAEVLGEAGVTGICTWTMRKVSYLGALKAAGNALRLVTMRYSDEVVPAESLDLPEADISERELRTGRALIESLTAPFAPEQHEDEHRKKLWNMIQQKAAGRKVIVFRPRELEPTPEETLLHALEESLKKVRHG
jgi:DNA end-binding protein Ku